MPTTDLHYRIYDDLANAAVYAYSIVASIVVFAILPTIISIGY